MLILQLLMKKSALFIVNPISGTAGKETVCQTILELADKSRFDYSIAVTEYAGHAEELSKEAAAKGIDMVVAVGGDGTVNEVARSIVHTPTALGIIPCGSGNGLARHLQIPLDMRKALQIINQMTIHCLDYGIINGQPFFCTCGVGFDAFISAKFAEGKKRGFLSYIENALREGLHYKPETYTIEDDEGTFKYNAFLIACANASQYGNNAYIAPNASMKDGLMDVTVMEPFNAIEAPQIAIQLFNRTIDQNSHIKTLRTKKVRIRRQSEGIAHRDGDPIVTGRDIEVEIVQKSFNVVVNPEAHSHREGMRQIFSDYFNGLSVIQQEFMRNGNHLKTLNRNILDKLRRL